MGKKNPRCIECGGHSHLTNGGEIYPHRDDLKHLNFYKCRCGAYVGCHKGTNTPLGFPAGPETRKLRGKVRKVLDPHWKLISVGRKKAREDVYAWLSMRMKLPSKYAHVAKFDKHQCLQALDILKGMTLWSMKYELEAFNRGEEVQILPDDEIAF